MMPSNWATHGRRSTRCSCERQGEAGVGLSLPLSLDSQPPSPWGSVVAGILLAVPKAVGVDRSAGAERFRELTICV
jgi:hypothetical protein